MRGTLATTLRKYYKRSGNRIVFKNGMTLTNLALEMWEYLGYRGIDASSLSRVINGERLMNGVQLRAFVEVLECEEDEHEELMKALIEDLKCKYLLLEDDF